MSATASPSHGPEPTRSALLLARDAAAFACLLHGCRRGGQDVLHFTWDGVYNAHTQEPAASQWLQKCAIAQPFDALRVSELLLTPVSTKTEKYG
jgi:hypothetical protein